MARQNIGSRFDDSLQEEGLLEDTDTVVVKRCIADQFFGKVAVQNLSKAGMVRLIGTSRSAQDRLLDPGISSVTLQTLLSAAQAPGGRLKVELDFPPKAEHDG